MKKIILSSVLFFCLFLISCQSIKDGLTGKKNENSDEFLVQKKNPLVLPPKYLELPEPKSDKTDTTSERIENETNIEKLVKNNSNDKKTPSKNYGNAEDFVLENIK